MGLAFGSIFGIMDMEDVSIRYIKDMLMKEENYCLPIGIICGGICGLISTMVDNNVSIWTFILRSLLPMKNRKILNL
jgi:hypothetical protein